MEYRPIPIRTNSLQQNPAGKNEITRIPSTAELIDEWIKYLDCSEQTEQTYRKAFRQFYNWTSEKGITNPTRSDVIDFRDDLSRRLKPSTIQLYMTALRAFYGWAELITDGSIRDITKRVKSPKLDKGFKKDYLTQAQAIDLLESIDRTTIAGKRDYCMILLMLTTGLRTISLIRADIGDIGRAAGQSVLYYQGKGKSGKNEYVKIAPNLDQALREYLKARQIHSRTSKSDPLFVSFSNKNYLERLTTRSIRRIVKNALIRIGLDDERLTTHSLRHTAATLNLLNGGSLEQTQQLLGHSNINTTLIYSHALERADNDSENRIESLLVKKP